MSKLFLSRSRPLPLMALSFALAVGLTGCGDNIFEQKWTTASVDTVLIYSLARPELNLPAAYDFVNRFRVVLQQPGATGQWDLLLDTKDGQLVFLPPGALDITSATRILALPGMAFDDVIRAPKDSTLYSVDLPIPVETTSVYVLRTHQGTDRFGFPCSFYGKFQPLEVDPVLGTVRFQFDVSRLCDDRGLIPTDE